MFKVRQPGFEFEPLYEEPDDEHFKEDWEDGLSTAQKIRYEAVIPDYVHGFLMAAYEITESNKDSIDNAMEDILSYLEFSFEVELENIVKHDKQIGLIKFSARNYPFGGLERFQIILKAYGLSPMECFNGFNVFEYRWKSDFEYDVIELPEKTKKYIDNSHN